MRTVENAVDTNELFKEDMIQFGKWVKAKREEEHMSLDDLAKQVGICKSYLHRLERGERSNPSYITVFLLAKALGKDLDEIILDRQQVEPLTVT